MQVVAHLRGMQVGFATLRDRASSFVAPDAAAAAAPDSAEAAAVRRRALYAAGSRVKYLVDAPEKVCVCVCACVRVFFPCGGGGGLGPGSPASLEGEGFQTARLLGRVQRNEQRH